MEAGPLQRPWEIRAQIVRERHYFSSDIGKSSVVAFSYRRRIRASRVSTRERGCRTLAYPAKCRNPILQLNEPWPFWRRAPARDRPRSRIPDAVWNRGSRADGVTEGADDGADIDDLRQHAGHADTRTTLRSA